jgi:hypothetical protein
MKTVYILTQISSGMGSSNHSIIGIYPSKESAKKAENNLTNIGRTTSSNMKSYDITEATYYDEE